MTLARRPLALIGILALLLFGGAVFWARPSFLADDYWWLWIPLHNRHFAWSEPYSFSRMPLFTLLTDVLLKTGAWEAFPHGIMTIAFGVHAVAFGLMLQTLLETAGVELHRREPLLFVFLALLFSFNPDNYEIHLWPIMSVDAVAELLIALAFRARSFGVGVLLATAGLLFYDSFAFLVAGFAALLVALSFFRDRSRLKPVAIRVLGLGICAAILWGLSKGILAWAVGFLHHPPIETSPRRAIQNLRRVVRTLWQIHFYKTNWVLTLLQWLAVIGLCARVIRRKRMPPGLVVILAVLPFAIALPLCLNTYDAPRSFFGAQLVQALSLAFLASLGAETPAAPAALPNPVRPPGKSGRGALAFWPLPLLMLVYATQWGRILNIKHYNSDVLAHDASLLGDRMARCQDPCVLRVPPPGADLRSDWVLPQFVWNYYYQRLGLLFFPNRGIRFEIQGK